jgi:hypothetical protein
MDEYQAILARTLQQNAGSHFNFHGLFHPVPFDPKTDPPLAGQQRFRLYPHGVAPPFTATFIAALHIASLPSSSSPRTVPKLF